MRALAAQRTEIDGRTEPLFGGVWALFGHGNVQKWTTLSKLLAEMREVFPRFCFWGQESKDP